MKAKKIVTLIAAFALVAGLAVAGTLAWLTDGTESIKNTFTTSDVTVTLAEAKTDFKMVPGYTIAKDPVASVEDGSEDCILFVKAEKSGSFDDYMTYEIADGWTELTKDSGIYYRTVKKADTTKSFSVLKGDCVAVKDTVTKGMMEIAETTPPTLTFTAYACQLNKDATTTFTAAEAWEVINPTSN